jgi:hypothetical protein
MMDAKAQDAVARALKDALESSGYVAARMVYVGGKLDRHYEPGAHELLAIMLGAGVHFYKCEGAVQADPRQLVLIP